MTIAVTGSSGLLGRHVVAALLRAGHAVVGIDRADPATDAAPHVRADLRQLGDAVAALQGASAVVHAAAIPRPTGWTPQQVFATNVEATFNVAEACVLHGVEQLVYASSFSVLGFPFNPRPLAPAYLPLDEDHPCAPQDAYALSKRIGEEIIDAAVRRSSLRAISLRMPWIQTADSFGREIGSRRHDREQAARDLWSYVDARDAGEAFRRAIETRLAGHVRLFVSARDTYMEAETMTLVREAYGDIQLRAPLPGRTAVIATMAAAEVLGFTANHSWREY